MSKPQPTVFPPTDASTNNCTAISRFCPVEFTVYGDYPSLPANALFCAFFGIAAFINLVLGIKYRTWTYLIALFWGCVGECVGYIGRIMLHSNPWSANGFEVQICCLIISPAFLAAGIYLTLKHVVIEVSESTSRLKPRWYTWIFIMCDLFSLILQGAGGGIAASADHGSSLQDTGNNLMMAGIVWQVFTLLVFGFLVLDYSLRTFSSPGKHALPPSALSLIASPRFKFFVNAMAIAYVAIFARCVFRIAEMAGGWGNSIMQDEGAFIGLDSAMITLAVVFLTAGHPGLVFPEMQMHAKTKDRRVVREEDEGSPDSQRIENEKNEAQRGRKFFGKR